MHSTRAVVVRESLTRLRVLVVCVCIYSVYSAPNSPHITRQYAEQLGPVIQHQTIGQPSTHYYTAHTTHARARCAVTFPAFMSVAARRSNAIKRIVVELRRARRACGRRTAYVIGA